MPTDYGSSSDYSVNGLNQITDETSGGSTLNISYDKNGNLTDDGVTTFGYDLFNRLTSTSGGTSFDYDATGRLYSITSSSANTYFLYDGQALIGEYTVDGSGNISLQRRYIHGLDVDTPIVWYEGSSVSNATRRYLVRDELGSVVLVTNNSGSAIQQNVYDEFGVPGAPPPAAGNIGRFQYTGQTWLDEAGLYYYKARVYNPYLGRFHQTDPIGYGDGLNMYAYVGNDPGNARDPSGRSTLCNGPCNFNGTHPKLTGRELISLTADFTPGVGDAKGAVEFLQEPTVLGGIAVAVGLVPIVGDFVGKGLKKLDDVPLFRGTVPGSLEPPVVPRNGEFKVDAETGIVKETRGPSVNMNPDAIPNRFDASEVNQSTIPDTLQIKQQGRDPGHHEIVPASGANLTPEQFIRECGKILCD